MDKPPQPQPQPPLPGNTLLPAEETTDTSTLPPLISSSASSASSASSKPVIVLCTNEVNDTTLFLNGLTQNIVILYDLFESLGYECHLLQNTPHRSSSIQRYRTMTPQDLIPSGKRIHLLIEIGMGIDPPTRQYLRSVGASIAKLYLGNILNIDIETIQYQPSIFFHHHVVGEIDRIWTSPHYRQHLDYAAVLNRVDPQTSAQVVPYVWDSCFLTQGRPLQEIEWIPPADWRYQDLVIMDPSISFQKCTFYSLLLAEAFSRRHPEWKGVLHVVNGDRLQIQSHARTNILPALSLYQANRIRLYGRKKIHEILAEHRSACFLTHQWNNDYNYMTLELMYAHFPLLHNSEGWKDYGYHYDLNQWDQAIEILYQALCCHKERLPAYRIHAAQLSWKHSIHHPEVRRRWKAILESV